MIKYFDEKYLEYQKLQKEIFLKDKNSFNKSDKLDLEEEKLEYQKKIDLLVHSFSSKFFLYFFIKKNFF